MIPKIIHYCWLSGDPYPEKIKNCISSWKKNLPGYEIWLWDADSFDTDSVPWVKEAVRAGKYAFAADYIRFYALYHYGGIYLDSDVEVLKSYDGLLDHDFFFGFEYSGQPEAATVGAVKHMKWIRRCMEWYESRDFSDFTASGKLIVAPVVLKYGFEQTYHIKLIDTGRVRYVSSGIILPCEYLSPKNGFTGEICKSGKTYSVHHFTAGWLGRVSFSIRLRRSVHVMLIRCLGKRSYDRVMYNVRTLLHQADGRQGACRMPGRPHFLALSRKQVPKQSVNSNRKNPLVSVIMPVCNDKPAYIEEAVNSILKQTYGRFELLVMDDSTDAESAAAVSSFASDPRVRICREGRKLGFTASLNKGLDLARGSLIARMDADDTAAAGRLEKQVKYLLSHPSVDILGGQVSVTDESGRVTGARSYPSGGLRLSAFFALRTPVAHPAVMFRRSVIDNGYRYDESLKRAEDIDFWLRLYNDGYKIRNIPDTVLNFRAGKDFLEKRVADRAQEDYVLKIRRRNFSMKRPFFSTASWLFSYVRQFTPDILKAAAYDKENGRKG